MQTLWSRTGLSARCACRACDQVLGAGRRATTRAPRRKATVADAFTALYSSVLATAAVVDAIRKEDRRVKVDAELEEVRDQLSELRAARAARELELGKPDSRLAADTIPSSDISDSQNRALWEQWRRIIDREDFLDDAWRAAGSTETTLMMNQTHVKPFGGVRQEPTTIIRTEITRILRHIESEELDDAIEHPTPTRPIHYENAAEQVRAYIRGLLTMAETLRKPGAIRPPERGVDPSDSAFAAAIRETPPRSTTLCQQDRGAQSALDQAWEELDSPIPEYWFRNHPARKEITIRLNNQIRELLLVPGMRIDELTARIGLCMLRSPCLPDVHTQNLLIAGFTRRRHWALASQAYELVFNDCSKLRSTPASMALSLSTPALFWDIAAFKRAAGAIIGRDPSVGAKIHRKPLADVATKDFALIWATDSARRGIAGRWVNAFAPMNLALREAIISSLLHLRQHVDAASFFLACLQTGASMAAEVVFDLFNALVHNPDARSAVRLIRGLSVRSKQFSRLLQRLPDTYREKVCRRLDYLLGITNLRHLDVEMIDDVITDLGMRRRHVENLILALEQWEPTSAYMNSDLGRLDLDELAYMDSDLGRLDLDEQRFRLVSGDPHRSFQKDESTQVADSHHAARSPSLGRISDPEQAFKRIQTRDQVVGEMIQLQVQSQLRHYAPDLTMASTANKAAQALQDALAEKEHAMRKELNEDLEEMIRSRVQREIEEYLAGSHKTANEIESGQKCEPTHHEEQLEYALHHG